MTGLFRSKRGPDRWHASNFHGLSQASYAHYQSPHVPMSPQDDQATRRPGAPTGEWVTVVGLAGSSSIVCYSFGWACSARRRNPKPHQRVAAASVAACDCRTGSPPVKTESPDAYDGPATIALRLAGAQSGSRSIRSRVLGSGSTWRECNAKRSPLI